MGIRSDFLIPFLQWSRVWDRLDQMDYEVTATRKRPQTIEQLAGQDFVAATLKSSIEQERIAHAYLFSGPRGVGKTSTARIFARSLNCVEGPTVQPCGVCSNCCEIARGNSLDVIEIDGASNTSVNDVREIRDEVLFSPNSSRYKIYIIDEVHMLSNSAFNALLKTIEEPPPYIIFIFATTEVHKVPATIRSRCQQYNFRLIGLDVIKEKLAVLCQESELNFEEDALVWIAQEAAGSLRDAYTLFDQVVSFSAGNITLEKIREKLGLVGLEQITDLVNLMAEGKAADVLIKSDYLLGMGIPLEQLVVELAAYFRNILFIKHGISRETILGSSSSRYSVKALEAFSFPQLEYAVSQIHQLYRDIRYSLNARFELDLLLHKLSALSGYITREGLLGEIAKMRQELVTGEVRIPESGLEKKNPERLNEPSTPREESVEAGHSDQRKESSADSAQGEERSGVTEDLREVLINTLKRDNRSLSVLLEKAEGFRQTPDGLFIFLKNDFERSTIKSHLELIRQVLKDTVGFSGSVRVTGTYGPEAGDSDQTETETVVDPEKPRRSDLFKSVFRGTIIGEETQSEY